jgi:adenine-specific DNA-methyltransferase
MNLVSFASENGLFATQKLERGEQKELGQFMTPIAIAQAMAARACAGEFCDKIRVLDPATGSGILAASVVEQILGKAHKPTHVEIVLYEIDDRLQPVLKKLADRMRRAGEAAGVEISVSIRVEDFLLADVACDKPQFDIVIANPPYFKLNKSDLRSIRHSYAVYGQPNIYGLFMAACARMLLPNGRWCFITPRSWTNGSYFSAVRRQILRALRLDAIHIFESRADHFTDDEILQEAMITWATAQSGSGDTVIVSASEGVKDLAAATLRSLPAGEIIGADQESIISVPATDDELGTRGWNNTLSSYGLKVSTGPVVAFRASDYLRKSAKASTVPLLWMQHVHHMRVSWPVFRKHEHIAASGETAWMLVPNANMVVMRRFSPKEDQRRITAAPYVANELPGAVIGLENHINYIYRPGGSMLQLEVLGLAAYLNSRMVDQYFRRVAGNTQVNAADLRTLRLPPLERLVQIGHHAKKNRTLYGGDQAVDTVLGGKGAEVVQYG